MGRADDAWSACGPPEVSRASFGGPDCRFTRHVVGYRVNGDVAAGRRDSTADYQGSIKRAPGSQRHVTAVHRSLPVDDARHL